MYEYVAIREGMYDYAAIIEGMYEYGAMRKEIMSTQL